MKHWLKLFGILAASAALAVLLIRAFDASGKIAWVGSTDLEVGFTVTDLDSQAAVPDARIEVLSDGGFYEERNKQQFELAAAADGTVRKQCRNSMCFGTRSRLGFTDTFVVHLPWWRYRVRAPGYETSEWEDLDVPENVRRVERIRDGGARLVVPVCLSRKCR